MTVAPLPQAQRRVPVASLLRRIVLVNAAVLVVGTAVLALSPATVSSRVAVREALVLAAGLLVMLAANALLLRGTLAPLDRLLALTGRVDLLQPGERLPEPGHGDLVGLVRAFNEMLARLEAERGASSARALAAQENERRRVAQELHDEVGQSLTVVLLGLKRAVDRAPDDLRPELLEVTEAVRSSLDEVRTVARRLRPGVLDDLGLASALSALATEFAAGARVRVERRVDPALPALSEQVELVVYRVAQEALTNVARHAAATTVDLVLARHPSGVVLRVEDDGRGLHGAAPGAGIVGMRERALLIGAELTVGPGREGGTQVRLVAPVGLAPESLPTAAPGSAP